MPGSREAISEKKKLLGPEMELFLLFPLFSEGTHQKKFFPFINYHFLVRSQFRMFELV